MKNLENVKLFARKAKCFRVLAKRNESGRLESYAEEVETDVFVFTPLVGDKQLVFAVKVKEQWIAIDYLTGVGCRWCKTRQLALTEYCDYINMHPHLIINRLMRDQKNLYKLLTKEQKEAYEAIQEKLAMQNT